MNDERRPPAGGGAAVDMAGDISMLPRPTSLAQHLLGRVRGARIPSYGSPEWDALPDQDPRRAAAVVRAAEAWRRHVSVAQVTADLVDELRRSDEALRLRVRSGSWDVAGAYSWRDLAALPTRDELLARRAS
jgi:hypothetical protein